MLALKLLLATVFVITSARHLPWHEQRFDQRYLLGFNEEGRPIFDQEQLHPEPEESYHPGNLARTCRASSSITLDSDGGIGLVSKVPVTGNENNKLSAIGTMNLDSQLSPAANGLGLQLENVNGHALTLMKQNVPGREDSFTAAGKLNVFHNDNHNVDVRGSLTRHMPATPYVPNFSTVGGGVDYMFKDKVGGSLGMSSTPFLDRKDYSAMGNLNLFKTPTSSFDFSGGLRKMDMPSFSTGWEPNFGVTWSKYF